MLKLPEIPKTAIEVTQEEINLIMKKIAEGYFNPPEPILSETETELGENGQQKPLEIEKYNWSSKQDRILYGLKYSGIASERQDEIRQVLWKIGNDTDFLNKELMQLQNDIDSEMKDDNTLSKTALLLKLNSEFIPKDKLLNLYKDAKCGKLNATWTAFKNTYKQEEDIS